MTSSPIHDNFSNIYGCVFFKNKNKNVARGTLMSVHNYLAPNVNSEASFNIVFQKVGTSSWRDLSSPVVAIVAKTDGPNEIALLVSLLTS